MDEKRKKEACLCYLLEKQHVILNKHQVYALPIMQGRSFCTDSDNIRKKKRGTEREGDVERKKNYLKELSDIFVIHRKMCGFPVVAVPNCWCCY